MTALQTLENATPDQYDALTEANHRIANNLALLAASIAPHLKAIEAGPVLVRRDTIVDLMNDVVGRVAALGRLHRLLSLSPKQDEVDLDEVLAELVDSLETTGIFGDRLRMATNVKGCRVQASHASVLMLVFTEIACNAIKYAHPTGLPVELSVAGAVTTTGGLLLHIADDGVGLPEGFDEKLDAGTGLKLIRALVRGAGGTVALQSDPLGLRYVIELPPAR